MNNSYTNRFQEYAPNYLKGEKETALIPIGTIDKVPISMLVGKKDDLCSLEQAKKTAKIIGDKIVHLEVTF